MRSLQAGTQPFGSSEKLNDEVRGKAYEQLVSSLDARFGGFGDAPKFPRPVTFNFLFDLYGTNPDSKEGKHALEMSIFTLRKMAEGGIHDHIGGGFHRYSTDRLWHKIDNKPTAYVCENFVCQLPTADLKTLADLLTRRNPQSKASEKMAQ